MIRKRFTTCMFFILTLVILSTGTFADTNTVSGIYISSDPIHPYIHDLMKNNESTVRLVDENLKDITDNIKKEISYYYFSGNFERVIEYLEIQKFSFSSNDDFKTANIKSIGTVPFSHTDKYNHDIHNLEMIYTITNQIFVSDDKFSGHTDPLWTLNYQYPAPVTMRALSLTPDIINSGYTYRLDILFVVSVYQYVYPPYQKVVYYHYM